MTREGTLRRRIASWLLDNLFAPLLVLWLATGIVAHAVHPAWARLSALPAWTWASAGGVIVISLLLAWRYSRLRRLDRVPVVMNAPDPEWGWRTYEYRELDYVLWEVEVPSGQMVDPWDDSSVEWLARNLIVRKPPMCLRDRVTLSQRRPMFGRSLVWRCPGCRVEERRRTSWSQAAADAQYEFRRRYEEELEMLRRHRS